MFRVIGISVVFALASFSCATTSAADVAGMAADPLKSAVTALASKVGINESYVTMALNAAQSLLGQGKDTATAAREGAAQAATKATADGKAFSADQLSGLTEGLAGLLGKK